MLPTNRKIIIVGVIVLVGVILTLVGWGLYLFRTTELVATTETLEIVTPYAYIDNGLFTRTPYIKYQIRPTAYTKPDTTYELTVSNNLVKRTDKFSWTPLELGIKKGTTIKHKISQDELASVQNKSYFTKTIITIQPERNGAYLLLPVLYLALVILGYMVWRERRTPAQPTPQRTTITATPPTNPISDEEQARQCLTCANVKPANGTFRCSRQKCVYQPNKPTEAKPAKIEVPEPQPAKSVNTLPLIRKVLSRFGAISQTVFIWMLTFCAGMWLYTFLTILDTGQKTFAEPNKAILLFEIAASLILVLCGMALVTKKLTEVK